MYSTQCQYTGQFNTSKNLPEEIGRLMWIDNSMYEGFFKDGKQHGYGRQIHKNGTIYLGMFTHGKKDGKAIEYFMREDGQDGEFKKGVYIGRI